MSQAPFLRPQRDRWPVIVGVAQLNQRERDPVKAKEPLVLMVEASQAAALDADCPALLQQADSVRVIRGIWGYKNPAKLVAERIGRPNAQSGLTPIGGNQVQSCVNQTCLDILEDRNDIVVITGAECGASQGRARKAGFKLQWTDAPGTPDIYVGHDVSMSDDAERARGLLAPIQIYPLFENALRAHRDESIPEHLQRIATLWAGFSKVAAHNPHAWLREEHSAERIRTINTDNRPVSFPYPKLMNSNSQVDQGAALILTSVGTARKLNIPEHKWIYPWSGSDAHDHLHVSHRDNLYSSPAIRLAGGRALELAGLSAVDIAHFDLYSCFPSAVQVAANELGVSQARALTVTGGLTFAGGPLNNYVMHGIARMVEVLRGEPQAKGMVTANGGFLTKHAFAVYAAEPPHQAYRHADMQEQVDALPSRDVLREYDGPVQIESYAVMYGAEGPQTAHCACLTPNGQRVWANNTDAAVMQAMTEREFCGAAATVRDGVVAF